MHRSASHRTRTALAATGICASLVLGGTRPANAQTAQGLELGAKAGVNIANVAFSGAEDRPDRSLTSGVVAGAFATLPLSGSLAFQVEGLYATKGVSVTIQGFKSKLVTSYLEVPLLARWTRRGGTDGYYLSGGAAPAWRLRARTVAEFGNVTESIDIGDEVERFDLGIVAGGGVERGPWVLDGRYTLGIRDIDRDRSDQSEMRHRAFSITAGWRF